MALIAMMVSDGVVINLYSLTLCRENFKYCRQPIRAAARSETGLTRAEGPGPEQTWP